MSERARALTPRCLRREEAASYVGVSPTTFDTMVKAGDMPTGFTYKGHAIRVWDREELDLYVVLARGGVEADQWEKI